MRRALFVCTSHALGGLELNMLRLAGWIGETGRRVAFVAGRGQPLSSVEPSPGLEVLTLRRRSRYADFPAAFRLERLSRRLGADRVVVSTTSDLDLSVIARKISRNRMRIVYLQQMPTGRKKDPIHAWKHRNLEAWVAPLPYLAAMTRERTRMPTDRIVLVPLCIDVDRFSGNPTTRSEARALLELRQEGLLFGLVGRIDPQKGQHLALDAFHRLATVRSDASLVFVGEPTRGEHAAYAAQLRSRADASPFSGRIHWRPFTKRPEDAFRALDVLLMTSRSEPYGMVTLEAMASGCAVIGASSGGTIDLLDHGSAGILVPPEDSDALGAAMIDLAGDPVRLRALAAMGPTHVRERYGSRVQVAGISEILDRL
jgi:glycosyltransferase involved in cell wall biosynthesis